MNKLVNSKCVCNKGLIWIKNEVIMLNPCEHLIHKNCYDKYYNKTCPYCYTNIEYITKLNDFKHNKQIYQKCIDILSMTNFDKMTKESPLEILKNLPHFLVTLCKIPFTRGIKSGKLLCKDIFDMNNVKINVTGLEYIKNEPKVFIANHTSNIDFMIIFYILGTGFLSSASIKKNIISRQLLNIIPCLLIDRSKKNQSTVNKMRDYVTQNGSICLFPEGVMTHPKTLIRFRTGAFNIGYPIYPIVITYNNVINDDSIPKFILKLASNNEINVNVQVLEPFYPPFDEHKIEKIRMCMAYAGKLMLSRVSNRDINDS